MKKLLAPTLLIATLVLTGCELGLANLTPTQVPKNPSGMYALNLKADLQSANIDRATIKPYIIVDGQKHSMRPAGLGPDTYTYDYAMPLGSNRAKYYYVVEYQIKNQETHNVREVQSDLFQLQLTNRYVSQMESTRGLVGSTIPLTGRGFTEFDTVLVGDIEADTQYIGPNVMTFTVPQLPAGKIYDVDLKSSSGTMRIGEFRVDAAKIRVNRTRMDLKTEERTMLVFQIDHDAPSEGLYVDVTTDIPESIIMPEVTIPGGNRTVSVVIQGGMPGHGNIFYAAQGYAEAALPVSVHSAAI